MAEIFAPPDGALLNAYANANLKWATVLGEWIDNALDAGARTISVEFMKDGVRVSDDGGGCENPVDMVRLGAHTRQASTRLGRYGIGGKDAALWVGGIDSTIRIHTVHHGIARNLAVSWKRYGKGWQLEDPDVSDAKPGETGTNFIISPTKRPPHGQDWKNLLAELGYLYSPAIQHGRQIKFKRALRRSEWEPLVRWEPPMLRNIIDARITVGVHGARVYCGIVQEGQPNPHGGFTYLHEWRVIEAASANGCGEFGTAHVCGVVDLDATWSLNKNKDGVSREADLLYAAVARVAEPVLREAASIGAELRSERFRDEVNDQLNAMLSIRPKKAKAKRGNKQNMGTVEPTGSGSPHSQARNEQPGTRFNARSDGPGRFRVDYDRLGGQVGVGVFRLPNNIVLNLDHSFVEASHRNADALTAIMLAAFLIVSEHGYAPDGQPLLKGIVQGPTTEDMSRALGAILSAGLVVDGKPLLKVS